MHFFEDNSRRMHLLMLDKGVLSWSQIELDINNIIPIYHSSIAVKRGSIMLAGGNETTGSKRTCGTVYAMDWDNFTLVQIGEMLYKRSLFSLVEFQDHIYAIGGLDDSQKISNVERVRNGSRLLTFRLLWLEAVEADGKR